MMPEQERIPIDLEDDESYEDPIDEGEGTGGDDD